MAFRIAASTCAFACVATVAGVWSSGDVIVDPNGWIQANEGHNVVRRELEKLSGKSFEKHNAKDSHISKKTQQKTLLSDDAVRRQSPKVSSTLQTHGSESFVQHADFLFNYPLPLPSLCAPANGKFPQSAVKAVTRQPKNKNVAVLIRGESFRNGGRGHREYCDDKTDSAEWQRAAVQNHIHMLVRPLEEKGYKVDLFFSTYLCPHKRASWNDDLVKWYGDHLQGHSFIPRGVNQTQSTTVRDLFKIFHEHTVKHGKSYDGGVVMTRFDFYLLKPFTEFSVYKNGDFGDKLMMNEWGGGDVFFTLPWYFMNCFAGTLEQNCWDNQFFSGMPCYYGLKANLINPQAQWRDPFSLADAGCTPSCPPLPARPSWVIHPWSVWKHQLVDDIRKCTEACSVLVATTPESAPKVCQVKDGCSQLCGNAGCSMNGPVFGPR
jgi:hypothetical protein